MTNGRFRLVRTAPATTPAAAPRAAAPSRPAPAPGVTASTEDAAAPGLRLINQLIAACSKGPVPAITESRLDDPCEELGLDSLFLACLARQARLRYGLSLPVEALAVAETPRLLLALVRGPAPVRSPAAELAVRPGRAVAFGQRRALPHEATNRCADLADEPTWLS